MLAQRLSMVSGVAQVNVFGAQKYAVRVDVDPTQLAARQIGIDQVAQAITGANVNRPTGTLYGPQRNFVVQASGQLMDAQAYRPIVVAYRNGSPVRLERGRERLRRRRESAQRRLVQRQPTIYLAIQRQPGTNTVEVVDAIKALLPQLQAQLPAALPLAIRSDRSVSIRESVHDVKFTLVLTVVLVVLVIFLFLRNLSATIIPSLALPFSIVGTFAVMWALGYSLDNLSLMALTLSVGFVVDDAIVMLENIVRHMEMGKTRMQAALDGSKEIAFTIVSMTLSLAAVFIPVLFMGGIVGRLMHEFAVTIAASILVSGLVSLTLTPMLCSRFLKPLHGAASRLLLQRDRAHVRRVAAVLRLDAATDDPLQGRRRWSSRRCCWSARSICSARFRRASSRASTPVRSTARSRRSGHRLRGDGRARASRSWTSCRRIRTSRRSPPTSAALARASTSI